MGIDEKTHEDNQCQCSPEWVNDDRAWKRGPGIRSPLTQPVACERRWLQATSLWCGEDEYMMNNLSSRPIDTRQPGFVTGIKDQSLT